MNCRFRAAASSDDSYHSIDDDDDDVNVDGAGDQDFYEVRRSGQSLIESVFVAFHFMRALSTALVHADGA